MMSSYLHQCFWLMVGGGIVQCDSAGARPSLLMGLLSLLHLPCMLSIIVKQLSIIVLTCKVKMSCILHFKTKRCCSTSHFHHWNCCLQWHVKKNHKFPVTTGPVGRDIGSILRVEPLLLTPHNLGSKHILYITITV